MRKKFFILTICISFFACQKKSNEYYLYHGLEGYTKFRYINEEFIEGYGVQKIAFFQEADQLQYVMMLTNNVTREMVANYSLGLQVYPGEKYRTDDKKFLLWDTKPRLLETGENKYIINGFMTPISEIDSLVFFLYDRNEYKGVDGRVISIKNIKL